jgi:hypothetical protein
MTTYLELLRSLGIATKKPFLFSIFEHDSNDCFYYVCGVWYFFFVAFVFFFSKIKKEAFCGITKKEHKILRLLL